MLMPGRHGYSSQGGWATGEGENGLPGSLTVDGRTDNEPAEYKATTQVEFVLGFESELGDVFDALITEGSGSGSGSGLDGSDGGYRYGFNGKEHDPEVKGSGAQYDYGFRIYDPRLGKFLSVDPLSVEYPWYTPYQFAGNMPIQAIDLDGAEPKGVNQNNPYAASHPGSAVKHIPSSYDNQAWNVKFDGVDMGLMHAYAIQDVEKRTYLIFETATGAKQQWYYEYAKGKFVGNVNSFEWYSPPDASGALTAITVTPLVAGPGAVTYGSAALGYVGKKALDLIAKSYPYWPLIGEAGRRGAEFLDETGTIGGANASRTLVDESRLAHIFRKEIGHFIEDSPQSRQLLEDVANDANNLLGGDKYGNGWYAKLNEKGQQIWAQVRDGKIINGGLNETPREFNVQTGLSAQQAPNKISTNE